MMPESRHDARRAEQELLLARRSTDPAVIKIHQQLAATYLSTLSGEEQQAIRQRVQDACR